MEQLQNLLNLINKFIFVLKLLSFSCEWTVEVFLNLNLNWFLNPTLLTALQKLHVKLPCDSQLILVNHWPDGASQFVWDSLFEQILRFVLEFCTETIIIGKVFVDDFIP